MRPRAEVPSNCSPNKTAMNHYFFLLRVLLWGIEAGTSLPGAVVLSDEAADSSTKLSARLRKPCLAAAAISLYSPMNQEAVAAFMSNKVIPERRIGFTLYRDLLFMRAAKAIATLSSTSIRRDRCACLAEVLRCAI